MLRSFASKTIPPFSLANMRLSGGHYKILGEFLRGAGG